MTPNLAPSQSQIFVLGTNGIEEHLKVPTSATALRYLLDLRVLSYMRLCVVVAQRAGAGVRHGVIEEEDNP